MRRHWVVDASPIIRLAKTGHLGLLVVAKREGDLAAVRPVTQALRRAGLHVDDDVVDQVLRMVGEA